LADAGVAARRVCERLIEEGHVRVNGEIVRRLPVFVDPDQDQIEVNGQRVRKPQRRVYLMVNKPAGTLVTAADEPGMDRPTVMGLVDHPAAPRLFPVGRLEVDATGLVLLTNDGELANRLTHPRYEVPKTYHAVVRGGLGEADVEAIGVKLRAVAQREAAAAGAPARSGPQPEISILRREAARTLLEITLREGGGARSARGVRPNDDRGGRAGGHAQEDPRGGVLREVLRLLGIPVKKLTRVGIGPLRLKALAVGQWRELTREELGDLRNVAVGRGPRERRSRVKVRRPTGRNPRPHRADNHKSHKPSRGRRS
jgi:23S rRNA pseudouridine2605 synthase